MSKLHFTYNENLRWIILLRPKKDKKQHKWKTFCWSLKWFKPVPCQDPHDEVTHRESPQSQDRNGRSVNHVFVLCLMNILCACIYPNTQKNSPENRDSGAAIPDKTAPTSQISLTCSSDHLQKAAWRVLKSVKITQNNPNLVGWGWGGGGSDTNPTPAHDTVCVCEEKKGISRSVVGVAPTNRLVDFNALPRRFKHDVD